MENIITHTRDIEIKLLRHRGEKEIIAQLVGEVEVLKDELNWQMTKFLTDFCPGLNGLQKIELDTSNPAYRYYNMKCDQYESIERVLRIAKAYA